MNRKADQAIKNAKARKTAQPDTDNTGRKEKKPGGHKVLRAIAAVCLVGIMLMCVAGCVLTVWAFDTLNTDQQMLDLSMQKAKYTTIFYADDGVTELARAYDPEAGNRIWVDYDQMPKCLLDATVAVEDKRFWEHNGVDFLTTSKAGLSAILQKIGLTGFYGGATPGASTITQQVVRNITNDRAVDGAAGWARKLREIFRALNVEKYYTKTQIIETYLNLASFSQNCSGIQAAANVFFNKDVSELTVAECATIVGTTKNPYAYDPFTHWEENQERKEYILGLMLEQGKLTKEEYNAAMAQEIVLATGTNSNATIQTWFVDYVTDEVCRDLAEKQGITEAEAYQNLIGGGYRIYTTCEERVQEILEDYYSSPDNFPPVNNEEYPQSAFVITDTNGALKGIVGGNRGKEGNRIWNRASDTTRQIGSTIKPITSYVLGIEKDLITYSTVIEDRQGGINPDEVSYSQPLWVPKNEYNSFRGFVTVRTAIIRSINTVAVQVTQMLGTTTSYDFLKYSLNVDTLTAGDNSYSPMALGSLSKGMTLVKLAGKYRDIELAGDEARRASYEDNQLHVQNQVLDNCLSTIKHETLYYPNKIRQLVGRLRSGGLTADEERETLAAVRELTDYYRAVFFLLSSCASRQLEEVTFRRTTLSTSSLLAAAERYFRKASKGKRPPVSLSVEAEEAQVVGDVYQLNFLFESLLDEALSVPLEGALLLSARVDGPFVRFSLADTRRDKSQDELNHLFSPSLERMSGGAGGRLQGTEYLIAKQIVRDHDEYAGRRGCRIYAERLQEVKGFVVHFTLPRKMNGNERK